MRRVWFTFKILEAFFSICTMGYHTRGFLNIDYIQDHYLYVATFLVFSLMTMFGCISICLQETISAFREGCLSMTAAFSFIMISINSMYHAEKDFYLMYLGVEEEESIEKEHFEELDLTEQPHSFFTYSKAQSIAALCCGCVFLLHAVLALDVAMTERGDIFYDSDDDDVYDPNRLNENLIVYVFGKNAHEWLNQFEWFRILADTPLQTQNEQLVRVCLLDGESLLEYV